MYYGIHYTNMLFDVLNNQITSTYKSYVIYSDNQSPKTQNFHISNILPNIVVVARLVWGMSL